LPDLTFYVRTVRNPVGATRSIERTVAQLDPSIPASNFRNLNMQIDETQTMDRLFAWLSISFAAAATLLASIGLYGLMAFAVMRRKFEIGIRIALGARRNQVLQLMMKEVWLLAIAGVSFGLLLAAWLVRFVQSQLYGIKAHDPFVMVFAAAGIFLLSGVAAYFPVRRAASGDPTLILRHE
ncbi:MAG TPA: FtsX-like permease family protein, partial [Bryobacteraceae bacterium]